MSIEAKHKKWATQFLADVLYEFHLEYKDGKYVHAVPKGPCMNTARRHFRKEIRRLATMLSRTYNRGEREGSDNPWC